MKDNRLRQFVDLRQALQTERIQITTRLKRIDAALAGVGMPSSAPASHTVRAARDGRRRRAKNKLTLKEAALKVTAKRPLTKAEILKAVEGIGYQFSAKSPIGSLNTLLYGRKSGFRGKDGKFGPA